MSKDLGPDESYKRQAAFFFTIVGLALGIAVFVNAPLSFFGSFALFRVLESHSFFLSRGRLIDIVLQLPVVIALHLTDSLALLRVIFCASYAAVPLIGLGVSWLVCRPRRPSLFLWPAMSICLIGLPGQFSFASEAIMAVTLSWPALLTALVGASGNVMTLVLLTSIASVCAHPDAAAMLGFVAMVAIASAVRRPELRRAPLRFAIIMGLLSIIRVAMPIDHYQKQAIGVPTLLRSFQDSVSGWPLIATILTMIAGVGCLSSLRSYPRVALFLPLIMAGSALAAWASNPASWMKFDDYRFWEPAFSAFLMACAAIEVLRSQRLPERELEKARRYLLPLIGGIFLTVVAIMSLLWSITSGRLVAELAGSERGCISFQDVNSVSDTALDQWSLGLYAIELQGRRPQTLLLKHNFACRMFAHSGDAILADNPADIYIKRVGEGWFDFESARRRAREYWKVKPSKVPDGG